MRLKGKIVVVTGATSGIGWETALLCAREGARVVGTGRDQARLGQLARHVELAQTMDVTDEVSVEIATAAILDRFGKVDVLINNAGVGLFKDWSETPESEIRQLLDVNFFGAVRVATRLLPALIDSKGVLVQVASVAGRRGYARHSAYCASKHALIGWSEGVRCDLKRTGASVVVVCPPAIDTAFFDNAGYPGFRKDHMGLRLVGAGSCRRSNRLFAIVTNTVGADDAPIAYALLHELPCADAAGHRSTLRVASCPVRSLGAIYCSGARTGDGVQRF